MSTQNMTVTTKEYSRLNPNQKMTLLTLQIKYSKIVKESNIENGTLIVFVVGSTAAITTIEYEPGLQKDFPEMLSRLVPKDIEYSHDNRWHDGNGHSHVRASLIGRKRNHSIYMKAHLNSWHPATDSVSRDGYKTEATQNHNASNG